MKARVITPPKFLAVFSYHEMMRRLSLSPFDDVATAIRFAVELDGLG